MEVYAGLLLIALCIAFVVVRVTNFRSTSSVANEKIAGSHQAQPKSQRRKRKAFGASSTAGSRFKQTDKTMTMARGTSAANAGIIRKPWGW